jgi:hypothetical protein
VQWIPKRAGFLAFMAESKVVYEEFEKILKENPTCERMRGGHESLGQQWADTGQRATFFLPALSWAFCVAFPLAM